VLLTSVAGLAVYLAALYTGERYGMPAVAFGRYCCGCGPRLGGGTSDGNNADTCQSTQIAAHDYDEVTRAKPLSARDLAASLARVLHS
jgi:hypothetical protein